MTLLPYPEVGNKLRAFICHSSGDKADARIVFDLLKAAGAEPWLDERNLLPGTHWEPFVEQAVAESDVCIILLSASSISKEGFVQKEIALALNRALMMPEGSIFILPLLLEALTIPARLHPYHCASNFDDILRALVARAKEKERDRPSIPSTEEYHVLRGRLRQFRPERPSQPALSPRWLAVLLLFAVPAIPAATWATSWLIDRSASNHGAKQTGSDPHPKQQNNTGGGRARPTTTDDGNTAPASKQTEHAPVTSAQAEDRQPVQRPVSSIYRDRTEGDAITVIVPKEYDTPENVFGHDVEVTHTGTSLVLVRQKLVAGTNTIQLPGGIPGDWRSVDVRISAPNRIPKLYINLGIGSVINLVLP